MYMITIIGEKFTIKDSSGKNRVYIQYQCECGKISQSRYDGIKKQKSCGCLVKNLKHNMYKTAAYQSWSCMLERCRSENSPNYKRYGGRGITISEEWKQFKNFYSDMGDRPEGYTLDRIDVNGDYCKENCKWSTPLEQGRNRTTNKMITINGITKCVSEWAASDEVLVKYKTITERLRRGWSPEDALYKIPTINTSKSE